jgi:hypothetical protein
MVMTAKETKARCLYFASQAGTQYGVHVAVELIERISEIKRKGVHRVSSFYPKRSGTTA